MTRTDTISVNPGKDTLGDKNLSLKTDFFRNNILVEKKKGKIDFCDLIFPSLSKETLALNKFFVPLRTIFATLLIICGISIIEGTAIVNASLALGIVEIILGSFLAIGLLSRPLMCLGAGLFGVLGTIALRNGIVETEYFTMMFGCLIFSVLGSGKYSVDYILRVNLKKWISKYQEKPSSYRKSYLAFKYATKNL